MSENIHSTINMNEEDDKKESSLLLPISNNNKQETAQQLNKIKLENSYLEIYLSETNETYSVRR